MNWVQIEFFKRKAIRKMLTFQQPGVFKTLIITKPEAPRLLADRYCLFKALPATLHTWLRSPSTHPEDVPYLSDRDRLIAGHFKLMI